MDPKDPYSHRITNLLPVPVMGYRTEPEFYRYERLRPSQDGMDTVVGDHGHFVGKDVLEAADELIQQEKAQIFEGPPIAPGRHAFNKKDYWLRVDTDEGRVWIPLPLKPVFKVGDHVHYYTEDRPTPPYWFGVIQEVHDWAPTVSWPNRASGPFVDTPPLISLRWVNPPPEPA